MAALLNGNHGTTIAEKLHTATVAECDKLHKHRGDSCGKNHGWTEIAVAMPLGNTAMKKMTVERRGKNDCVKPG